MSSLDRLLSPRRVAFVGVSSDSTKPANRGVNFTRDHGFGGEIYGVNPSAQPVPGVTMVSSIGELPEGLDVAVLALPSALIIDAVRACGERGIPNAIVFANGFADVGDHALQDELKAVARDGGVRLVGPNCLGVLDMRARFAGTFSSLLPRGQVKQGRIGLVSQSGAVGNTVLLSFSGLDLGISAWMATGNEVDINALEAMDALLARDDTDLLVAVLEAVNDAGDRLRQLGARSRATGKPILVFKAGKSDASKRAAESHTGKIVGSHEAWNRAVADCGLLGVDSLEHLTDAAIAFDLCGWREAGPIAILCGSGGMGGIICDDVTAAGLSLATLSASTRANLRDILPSGASTLNPVDPTTVSESNYYAAARALLHDQNVGVLLLAVNSLARNYASMRDSLGELATIARDLGKHVAVTYFSPFDTMPPEMETGLRQDGVLIIPTSARLARCIGTVNQWGQLSAVKEAPDTHDQDHILPSAEADHATPRDIRSLPQMAEMLGEYGIPVIPTMQLETAEQAIALPKAGARATVLKLESSTVAHKSDAGLVRLNLTSEAEIEGAFAALSRVQKDFGGQIVAQPQLEDRLEVIVGGVRDAELGWLVTVGLGGILVELIGELDMALCPLSIEQARDLVARGRLGTMLRGYRGQAARDAEGLAAIVAATSRLLVDQAGLTEFELNPVMIGAAGEEAFVVDALAAFAPSESRR